MGFQVAAEARNPSRKLTVKDIVIHLPVIRRCLQELQVLVKLFWRVARENAFL